MNTVPADRVAPGPTDHAPLIELRGVSVSFRGIKALQDITFDIPRQKIVGLIGPNGAGKTTLFNCLSRLYTPVSGDILMNGRSILSEPRSRIAQLGIARTFQNVSLFDKMSVQDNVLVGGHVKGHHGFLAQALKPPPRGANRKCCRPGPMKSWPSCASTISATGWSVACPFRSASGSN